MMTTLSDNQLDLLKSFLTALSQQPLGFKEFQAQLSQIAQNLAVGVESLDELANANESFKLIYDAAYAQLDNEAVQRGVGLDFTPDASVDTSLSTETGNQSPDLNQRPATQDVLQHLQTVQEPELIDKTRTVFQADDPVTEFYQQFYFSY